MRQPIPQKKTMSRSNIRWGVAGVFVLLLAAAAYDAPQYVNRGFRAINTRVHIGLPTLPEKNFALGLDLQGGAHLIYQADVSNIGAPERAQAVEGVRDVVERRVNGIGISESAVQTAKVGDQYRLLVELPGVTDVKRAIAMIGETPILEFKEENHEPQRTITPDEKKQLDKDNADAKKRIDAILRRVQKGESFEAVAKQSSEDEKTKVNGGYMGYVKSGPLYDWAKTVKPGANSMTSVNSPEGYNVLKRGAEKNGEIQAKASHILICYLGAQNCQASLTKEEAKKKAEDLFKQANASNFAQLAKDNSTDGTKNAGGDLGFFTRGMMVPVFENAVFNAKVGDIVGPVESDFGYHIIYKTAEEPQKEIEVWRILVKSKTEADVVPPVDPWKATGLSGKQLSRASVTTDSRTGEVQVSLQFNSEGTELFRSITERNVGKPVAIFLDGEALSTPRVNQIIPNGQAVISGGFTMSEAQLLAQRLNAGALPVPVELISQQTVGATLGADSLDRSLHAGVIAVLLVLAFMVLYYRLPGIMSVIALAVYISLTLAVFKLMGVTLTLAGIAGFIMSVGVAVDANVLIFERLKEELRNGKGIRVAVEEGFLRAWPSIRDSNLSTLITCMMLIWLGTSFVKGFAITLSIGILVSIFTAVTVTRVLLRFVVPWFDVPPAWLFLGAKKPLDESTPNA